MKFRDPLPCEWCGGEIRHSPEADVWWHTTTGSEVCHPERPVLDPVRYYTELGWWPLWRDRAWGWATPQADAIAAT